MSTIRLIQGSAVLQPADGYEVDVTLCAYSLYDYQNALAVFEA